MMCALKINETDFSEYLGIIAKRNSKEDDYLKVLQKHAEKTEIQIGIGPYAFVVKGLPKKLGQDLNHSYWRIFYEQEVR